jgi:hypothetical protein
MKEPDGKFKFENHEVYTWAAFEEKGDRTVIFDECGDTMASIPILVINEREAEILLETYRRTQKEAFGRGVTEGKRQVTQAFHQLLGVDKIVTALENLAPYENR